MNVFAHGHILHTFLPFVKSFSVKKRTGLQEEIMQIAKSGVDKRSLPGYNAIHEGKGVFECMHSEALFLFENTRKRQRRLNGMKVPLWRRFVFSEQEESECPTLMKSLKESRKRIPASPNSTRP
ncbi:MAG: hypothetical protein IKT99_05520 [Oscillospiraceae bacterium]|nr:hypothetical protein [Oscillospiraceae bacterium]